MKFTTKNLQTLKFVCETGGNNPKVKWEAEALESFLNMALIFGKLKLTKAGRVNVFDTETNKWLGYIKLSENGIPRNYPADEDLYFKDLYQEA